MTDEPKIQEGEKPLHDALVAETRCILDEAKVRFMIIEHFGLDIGVFFEIDSCPHSRFIEAKAYTNQRNGGVPLSGNTGGPQVNLLLHDVDDLAVAGRAILWVLGDGTKPEGSERFVTFDSVQAKNSAMGGVVSGKYNNLKISSFEQHYVVWPRIREELKAFLLGTS